MALALATPAGAWTAGIDITTGQATYDLTYGIEPDTTAEFDNGMDAIVPPPAPGMTKYAYFVTTGTFRELSTDIRPETVWQLYMMSDENISITWDQPPVPLSLTLITMTENDAVIQQVPDISGDQSLSLEPGTHIVKINAAAASSGNPDSGNSDDAGYVTYHPPAVVTEATTPAPTDTPPLSTPAATAVQTGNPTVAENAAAIDTPTKEGGAMMTVAVPAATKALPTQSPVSAAIPLGGLGIIMIRYLKKQ